MTVLTEAQSRYQAPHVRSADSKPQVPSGSVPKPTSGLQPRDAITSITHNISGGPSCRPPLLLTRSLISSEMSFKSILTFFSQAAGRS